MISHVGGDSSLVEDLTIRNARASAPLGVDGSAVRVGDFATVNRPACRRVGFERNASTDVNSFASAIGVTLVSSLDLDRCVFDANRLVGSDQSDLYINFAQTSSIAKSVFANSVSTGSSIHLDGAANAAD